MVLTGFFTTCVTLLPFFQTNRFRAFRAGLFAALGLWGIAPSLHGAWLHCSAAPVQAAFLHDLVMGALYLVRLCNMLISVSGFL